MNQLAILAPGQQTLAVSGLIATYQVIVTDPDGNAITIDANGSIPLPPLTFGQVYRIVVQNNFGAPAGQSDQLCNGAEVVDVQLRCRRAYGSDDHDQLIARHITSNRALLLRGRPTRTRLSSDVPEDDRLRATPPEEARISGRARMLRLSAQRGAGFARA